MQLLLLVLLWTRGSLGCAATRNANPPEVSPGPGPVKPVPKDCQNCDPLVLRLEAPYQALALDRLGNDAVDGCATRTVECKGLENPLRTRLVWDATVSEDTLASVKRTIKCNAARQWVLSQDGGQITVKEVGCLATAKPPDQDRCKECAPIDVVLGGPFMGKAMNVGVGADDRGCAISTVECRGEEDPLRTSIVVRPFPFEETFLNGFNSSE
uniref:C6 domain-containing protein n=1 Tax=Steinernema glaseri TaxID=37863 RepID=A0A1I8ACW0_9BILA